MEERGLSDRVVFAGQRADVPELLHASDVVALASRREGVPRSLMEAMAAHIPVVATDVVGTRELVQHDRTGLLVPLGDVAELARALSRLLEDEELRGRLARAAAERVARDFREELVTARVDEVYRRCLERRDQPVASRA